MIIYCDSGGKVTSLPSSLPFGDELTEITVIAFQMSATAILKIKPPNQEYLPDIICAPALSAEGMAVYTAKLPKSVTMSEGRCKYQLEFVIPEDDGTRKKRSFPGSFLITEGIPTDMDVTEDMLKDYTIDSIYEILSNTKKLFDQLVQIRELVGVGKELETNSTNIIDAINEIIERGGTRLPVAEEVSV